MLLYAMVAFDEYCCWLATIRINPKLTQSVSSEIVATIETVAIILTLLISPQRIQECSIVRSRRRGIRRKHGTTRRR